MELSQKQFNLVLGDAISKCFNNNNNRFPAFDKMAKQITEIVFERLEHINGNEVDYKKFFKIELELPKREKLFFKKSKPEMHKVNVVHVDDKMSFFKMGL